LEEVCLPVTKVVPGDAPEEPFIYIDIASIDNSSLRIAQPKTYLGKEAPSRARQRIAAGDTLLSTVRTYLRNIALVPPEYDGQVASTGFCVLRPSGAVHPGFLFYAAQTDDFISALNPLQRGTSYPAVRNSDVLAQVIALPPLPEQRRIVAEIEKHFTRIDAAVASLQRARANLKRYCASVLKTACEGRLVPNEADLARRGGREYEPASVLLENILRERRARWTEPKGRRGKYGEPRPPETASLPSLPEGWVWVTAGQVAANEPFAITDGPFGSNLKTSHYTSSGARVIRLQNVGDGRFVDERAYVSMEHFNSLRRHHVRPGDLVIAALGEKLPRACLVPEFIGPAMVKADCIRLRPDPRIAVPEFLNYVLNAEPTRTRTSTIVHGVGRPRLNLQEIKVIAIPLAPLVEQQRIVAEAEQRLSAVEAAEAAIEVNLKRAERLRQAILRRAFEGKLVPQDPTDEPASALLDRVRAERERAARNISEVRRRIGRRRKAQVVTA
jgi:type I restriction enzyme S subunit